MFRSVLALCLLLAAGVAVPPDARAGDAPSFSLADAGGAKVSLADLRGKVVYLDFWASWCLPCMKSFPWLSEMQNKYNAQGLEVVAVNVDKSQKDAAKFLKRVPHDFTILYDPDGVTPAAYGLQTMPSSYVIGRDGGLRLSHSGFRDADREELDAAIRAALEAK